MPKGNSADDNGIGFTLNDLPQSRKIAVIVFFIFAIIIIIFWVWQIREQINKPFFLTETTVSTSTDLETTLKSLDTDGDGLSNYDEIYVYKTSPYLQDSDSDGLLDNQEVLQGTDPNCPQGKNCNAVTPSDTGTNIISSSSPVVTPTQNSIVSPNASLDASGVDQAALQSALNGQIDVVTLRQLLISSGVNKADLDKISDEDLMAGYQATLQAQGQTN